MTTIQPVEAVEQKYPIRVERTTLREDSGGDGRWRGGLGLSRELRLLAPDARFSALSEKNILPPYGVCGGASGAPNRFVVAREGHVIEPSALPGKVSGFPCAAGDVVLLQSSGGGGYGDPLERDPDAVARDVADGYVSAAKATAVYGVVLAGGQVDGAATATRRGQLRAARCRVRLEPLPASPRGDDRPVCRLSRAAAAHLAVGEGDIVELVNPGGAPVRARVGAIDERDGALAWLSADALALLAGAGGEVEVRAVARRRAG